MEKWEIIAYMVALYIFLNEFRTLDPFMTSYLTGPDGNVSLSEVANTMESIRSYSGLFGTLLMLCSADYLLYKPNILFLTSLSCLSYLLMTNSPSLIQLRVSMVGLGVMYSANVLGLSYLYAQITDTKQLQMATGICICAMQFGRVVGDVLSQFLVNITGGIYTFLPYCNVLTLFLALICASRFPPVIRVISKPNECSSLLQYDTVKNKNNLEKRIDNIFFINKYIKLIKTVWKEIKIHFKSSYSKPILLKNSLNYIIGHGLYILVLTNINVLYSYVVEKPGNHDVLENGIAEAIITLFGAAGAFIIGKIKIDWTYYSDIVTAICSMIMGCFLILCYFCDHLFYVYFLYLLYNLVFQSNIVIIYAGIAKELNNHCYSLILEFNYLLCLCLVSIITLFLIQINFMNITIPGRFLFFGGLYVLLGFIFLYISIFKTVKKIILY